jgi:hypothetical protein
MSGEGGRRRGRLEEGSAASRGRGTGTPASGLGPTAAVHSSGARRGVEAGRSGVGQCGGERLGRELVGVGEKGVRVAGNVHSIGAWRSADTRKVPVDSNHAQSRLQPFPNQIHLFRF